MTEAPRPVSPESWDEAVDLRRFWWVLFPLGIAIWAAAVIVFLDKESLGPFTPSQATAVDRFEERLPVGENQRFVVQNIHGSLRIETGPAGEATIVVERTGSGSSKERAQEAVSALNHRVFEEDGAVVLVVGGVAGRDDPVTAAVTLTIPPGSRVEAETLFGDIEIETTGSANVAAGTANGDIEITIPRDAGIKARLEAHELRTQLPLVEVGKAGGRALFESAGAGDAMVDLDLRAPAGVVTLRER